jgi:Porin subfamily
LLGSAASLFAFTSANAADVIMAEPEPVEYVRVCDSYGPGYFYIPGTDTCLRIGGYVRYDVDIATGSTLWIIPLKQTSHCLPNLTLTWVCWKGSSS